MSIVRLFADAATGALAPQSITPAGSVPAARPTPAKLPQENEDAAVVTLSTAAKEFNSVSPEALAEQQAETSASSEEGAAKAQADSETPSLASENADTGEGSDDAAAERQREAAEQSEKREIQELQARDREVRAHEQAHLGSLGPYSRGGASYTLTTGPDGKQYATGGEVPVDVSPEGTPEQTIQKAQTVRRAALAPAEPSGADRAVAAKASQLEAQARAEIQQQSAEETTGTDAVEPQQDSEEAQASASDESASAAEESEESAEFFSGRLVGASAQAFQTSAGFADASSARGGLLDVNA